MPVDPSPGSEPLRAAEVAGALCLATDLGMGFPFEHGLRTTLIAMRLAERLGADRATTVRTYYAAMLSHAGCTTDAHLTAEVFGGPLTTHFHPVMYGSTGAVMGGLLRALPDPEGSTVTRALQTASRFPRMARTQSSHLAAMCEVAQLLSDGIGLPGEVREMLAHLLARWDGKGPGGGGTGEEIPLAMRIVHVAVDAALQLALGGEEHAVAVARANAGRGLDPRIATRLADEAAGILALEHEASAWDEVLAGEPRPHRTLPGDAVDRALTALGSFADLISPAFSGHAAGVAELASAAAERCRVDAPDELRRAALVHDLGRVAVGARTWQRPGPLSAAEWEQVRLHPYHGERILSRSPSLSACATVAGAHHERLDGSGYHRGCRGADLPAGARVLAAADAYHAMTQPRPHRKPLPPEDAAEQVAEEASDGRLDADAVAAVVAAAGQHAPPIERPAGLTERESEVLAMVARGLQTKQVARALGISVKTADRHVQNAYGKIGVSTRAAATLFAMEQGLMAWGELPMARSPARP